MQYNDVCKHCDSPVKSRGKKYAYFFPCFCSTSSPAVFICLRCCPPADRYGFIIAAYGNGGVTKLEPAAHFISCVRKKERDAITIAPDTASIAKSRGRKKCANKVGSGAPGYPGADGDLIDTLIVFGEKIFYIRAGTMRTADVRADSGLCLCPAQGRRSSGFLSRCL